MRARSQVKIAPALTRENLSANLGPGLLALAAAAISIAVAPDARGVLGAGLALVMMAIAVIDGRRFIIPNELTASALALGFVHAVLVEPEGLAPALAHAALRALTLALAFLALRAIYSRLRGREGLGLGDVKLAGSAGVWLDWSTMPIAIEIAALAALAVYIVRHLREGRPLHAGTRLPFGLFLAPAVWLAWLFQTWLDVH